MNKLMGKWIWFASKSPHENMVGCFACPFSLENPCINSHLQISAETCYAVCINGQELGRGPIRSYPGEKCYDTYDITAVLLPGENLLTIRVWDYGWSTYQSIACRGGLIFDITQNDKVLAASGEDTRAMADEGHKYNTVKRNVNLGFMEYQDARKSQAFWQDRESVSRNWDRAVLVEDIWGELRERPIPLFSTREQLPLRVVANRQVMPGCQQVTVNTRPVFFPERRDANETIFAAFLGVVIDSPTSMFGEIVFPNRTWNGIIGDFKIGRTLYSVDNAHREVPVHLAEGKQLFLLQISGKFDDLFCHIEFHFPEKIVFTGERDTTFFLIGPTEVLTSNVDGCSRVYGGLNEFNRMESHTALHQKIFACTSLKELKASGAELRPVLEEYVFFDEYIYSLVKSQRIVREMPVQGKECGLIHGNSQSTVLPVTESGIRSQLILDFGDIYVGALEFSLSATAGTVVDFYGFENMFEGKIDFTVGLNNSIRYICREGTQTFRCMTRTGCRYLAVTVGEQTAPVEFYGIRIFFSTYPASGIGNFRCNDDKLNRIWEICRQTHLNCMEDTFTDCPTYEQSYWIGDALISAYINSWMYGEYPLMRHCLKVVASAVSNTSLMNALGPTDWSTSIPMWTMNWILAIDKYVQNSGDDTIIRELYSNVQTVMETFYKFISPDGAFLINAWNMLDWAALDIYNYGVVTGQQAVLAECCKLSAGFARRQGLEEDARKHEGMRKKLLHYIDSSLWDAERGAFLDGWSTEHGLSKTVSVQTHSLLILYNGIIDSVKKISVERLLDDPPKDFVQVGSPFFLFYLYELWAPKNLQKVLDDIRLRWTGMMRYDCTTCWEVFPGFYEVGRTRSYCHSWSASPVYFLNRYLLGINPVTSGFRKLEVSLPETDLSWCEGTVPTPLGAITVYWSRENGKKSYQIIVPEGVDVSVREDFDWKVEISRLESATYM